MLRRYHDYKNPPTNECIARSGFTCRGGRDGLSDPNACGSALPSDSSFVVHVISYIGDSSTPSTVGTTTTFYALGNIVLAKGLIVWRGKDDPEWPPTNSAGSVTTTISASITTASVLPMPTSIPTMTSTEPPPNSGTSSTASDLSIGAKVGIGVGVSVGIFAILGAIAIGYLFGRRKRRSTLGNSTVGGEDVGEIKQGEQEIQNVQEMATQREPVELMAH